MRGIKKLEILIPEEEFLEVFKQHSFNVRNDLKQLKLNDYQLLKLIKDQNKFKDASLDGRVIFGDENNNSIKKVYLSFNNSGKKRGLRVIALALQVENVAIIIHVYNKSNKKDITRSERDSLRKILNEVDLEEK